MKNKTKKIYCENCRYRRDINDILDYDSYLCSMTNDMSLENRNHNCIYYKKKWYLFWVR